MFFARKQAAMGKVTTSEKTRLKLLNGAISRSAARKITRTGSMHHKCNESDLFMTKVYYDGNPTSFIVIPFLDLYRILNWNGMDEYDVMAITCCGETSAKECQERTLKYAATVLVRANESDREKIEGGRKLLEILVQALSLSSSDHIMYVGGRPVLLFSSKDHYFILTTTAYFHGQWLVMTSSLHIIVLNLNVYLNSWSITWGLHYCLHLPAALEGTKTKVVHDCGLFIPRCTRI